MTNNRNIRDPWLENQLARLVRAASEREVGPGLQKIQDDLLAYVGAHRDPRFIPGPPLCEMCAPSGECHTGGCPGGSYLAESPAESAERTKRLQARHERDCAVEKLAAARQLFAEWMNAGESFETEAWALKVTEFLGAAKNTGDV